MERKKGAIDTGGNVPAIKSIVSPDFNQIGN
jgi:hypothetical protein